jgi:hypothetical protein
VHWFQAKHEISRSGGTRAPRAIEANRFWRQSSRIKSEKVLDWPPGMLGEQIVIVDPRSMEIVAIIDA